MEWIGWVTQAGTCGVQVLPSQCTKAASPTPSRPLLTPCSTRRGRRPHRAHSASRPAHRGHEVIRTDGPSIAGGGQRYTEEWRRRHDGGRRESIVVQDAAIAHRPPVVPGGDGYAVQIDRGGTGHEVPRVAVAVQQGPHSPTAQPSKDPSRTRTRSCSRVGIVSPETVVRVRDDAVRTDGPRVDRRNGIDAVVEAGCPGIFRPGARIPMEQRV